jgi:FkbM family methyltransferase
VSAPLPLRAATATQAWLGRRDVLVARRSTSNELEPLLQRVLRALAVDVFVDVGANQGQTVELVRALGYRGEVVSFEPTAAVFDDLRRAHAADQRWRGHNMALGEEPGTLELHRFADSKLNSLRAPSSILAAPVESVEQVRVERLDDVWDDTIPSGAHFFLKMDTQGSDLSVLRGAAASLRRIDGVLTEVSINSIYEQGPTLLPVLSLLDAAGFELAGLFPGTRDDASVRLIEADALFVRAERLPAL